MPTLRVARRPKRLPRPPRPPSLASADRRYLDFLGGYVRAMHEATMRLLLPALERAAAALHPRVRQDDDDESVVNVVWETIGEAREELRGAYPDGRLAEEAGQVGQQVSAIRKEGLTGQIHSVLGLDPLIGHQGVAGQLALFRRGNVELIKSIDQRYFGEVEGIVQRGLQSGTRPEQMAREIAERYQVSVGRANLIARDQVGKLAGQMDRIRQTELGLTHYVWRTAKDERVRDEHAEREGERFAWDDPPEDGHPGEPVRCRCYAEPDLAGLLDRLEGEDGGSPLPPEETGENPNVSAMAKEWQSLSSKPFWTGRTTGELAAKRTEAVSDIEADLHARGIVLDDSPVAVALLDAREPGAHVAAMIDGKTLSIRPEHRGNPRILAEELGHAIQMEDPGWFDRPEVEIEIEARLNILKNAEKLGLTDLEIRSIKREISRMFTKGSY